MYLKIIGILIIVCALVYGGYCSVKMKNARMPVLSLTLLAVFAGIALLISNRITELTVRGVGTIKAATAQATSDAGTISALKVRVEDQSATVDAIAKEASDAAGLSEQVSAQITAADKKLAQIDEAISIAKTTLASLQADSAFSTTVEEAQSDDRAAFDKLHAIALDPKNPYAIRAAKAWNEVLDSHSQGFYQSGFKIPWKAGFDPSTLSLLELEKLYYGGPDRMKVPLLEYINNRNDIPKIDKLDFFMHVMKIDQSLTAVEYAGRYFTTDTNLNIKPLAVDYLAQWWAANRKNY